jgi:hypothetical protein
MAAIQTKPILAEGMAAMTEWPQWLGWDYRYGFPISPNVIVRVEEAGLHESEEFMQQLEAAAFEALVRVDLEELP